MNSLIYLENLGFKVCWKLIKIGLYGNNQIPVILTYDETIDYLDGLLTNATTQTDSIISLLCEKDNSESFERALGELALEDKSNTVLQNRKWRAYLLNKALDTVSEDCLQGMLALTEYWMTIGEPKECPMAFPINNNSRSINDFFSESSYEIHLKKNQDWLDKEIVEIIRLDALTVSLR